MLFRSWLSEWLQKNAEDDKCTDVVKTSNEFYSKLLKSAGLEEEHHPIEDIERSILDTEYADRPESSFDIKALIQSLKEEQGFGPDPEEEMVGLEGDEDEGFEDE